MDARMESLDATVEAFGESRQLLDGGHGNPRCGDPGRGGSGGHQFHPGGVEGGSQLLQTLLVVDAEQRAAQLNPVGHVSPSFQARTVSTSRRRSTTLIRS